MGFVNREQENVVCKNLDIRINHDHESFFVEKEDIISIIVEKGIKLIGKPLSEIDYNYFETLISTNPFIYNAEVYSTITGELKIDIIQRRPIIRIMGNSLGNNFYLDEQGKRMPLSRKYTLRVLIANGHITKKILDDLFILAKYIDENKFWKAQIQQIYVDKDEEIYLIPRVGRHKIIFGDVSDLNENFSKLMIFYKKGLNYIGWNKYKTINLKYKDQIVCTK